MFERENVKGKFVVTDCDIVPIEECPLDAIDYFSELLDFYPDIFKAGFGFKLDDIPDTLPVQGGDDHVGVAVPAVHAHGTRASTRGRSGPTSRSTGPARSSPAAPRSGPATRTSRATRAGTSTSDNLTEEERFYRESVPAANRQWEAEELPFRITEWLERARA